MEQRTMSIMEIMVKCLGYLGGVFVAWELIIFIEDYILIYL